MLRRALNSVTIPWAENTLWTGETQKNQNRQYGDKKERHHKDSVRFSF